MAFDFNLVLEKIIVGFFPGFDLIVVDGKSSIIFDFTMSLYNFLENLGGVESLIELPAPMTHASVADSPFAIDPGLVRVSVGIENADDLIVDLGTVLSKI